MIEPTPWDLKTASPHGQQGAASLSRDGLGAPRSLTSAVCERIRKDIVTCELTPGERIRIGTLKDRFNVSLSIVREALSRLVTDGLVQAVDQVGFRVSPVSYQDIVDIANVRTDLESTALRLSIQLGDSEWVAGVLKAHELLANATPVGAGATAEAVEHYAVMDRKFHTALVAACGSPWLMRFRDMLHEQVVRYCNFARVLSLPKDRDVVRDHRELMEAVLSRDADLSVRLVAAHFTMTSDRVAKALSAGLVADTGSVLRADAS